MRAHGAPQVEIGGKGGRAGSGRCPPPWRLVTRAQRGGRTAPPRCRAPAAPCAGDDARCALLPPLPTGAWHSPALVCAGGREPWCSWPSAGTAGTAGRLEDARGTRGCALRVALDVMPGARVQDAHDFLAGTRAGRLRVKTGVSRWPDGPGYTPLALCVQGDAMDVLSMAASRVRSTLPPLHPHPHSRGRLSAEICWLGRNMRGMRVT